MEIKNPLEAIYAYAEQTYIRLQAGDLLMRCIDTGTTRPMQELVEGLVFAGPQSIGTLYEIMQETGQRRAQIQDDLQRLYGEFQKKLTELGIGGRDNLPDAYSFIQMDDHQFSRIIESEINIDDSVHQDCFQLFDETQDLMSSLTDNIVLMQEIENYLKDWLWGLAFLLAREAYPNLKKTTTDWTI